MLTGIASAGADCGQFRTFSFELSAPEAFHEVGVHAFQWREEFLDATGTPFIEFADNQVETIAGASTYPGSVLLRLRSNWAWQSDGSVNFSVQSVDPSQDLRFYATVFCEKGDPFCGKNRLWVRWQDGGSWTPWTEVPAEPVTGACTQFRRGVFERSYGAQ